MSERGSFEERRRSGFRLRVGVALLATTMLVAGLSVAQVGASRANATKYDDNATVVFAGAPVGQDLDPFKAGGTLVGIVDIYDGLIRATPDLKLVPDLATAWKVSTDNLKVTVTLRDGVKFSDGSAMDSAAVVASLNRARSGSTSQQKVALASVSAVTAVDPKTVEITLSHPDPTIVNVLATPAGFVINPKMITDDAAIRAGKAGVGTGAYTLRSFLVGNKIILDRNDSYWDAAAVKHAPKVYEYDVVSDGSARLNGLKTGQFVGIQSSGTPGINGAGGLPDVDKNFVNTTLPGLVNYGVGFRLDKPPFDNEKVRLAVAHAIDFKTLTGGLLHDEMNCSLAPDGQLWAPGQTGYSKLAPLKFDLKLAKQLLAEAGYPDGKGFPAIAIGAGNGDYYSAQAFQPMLARIGITSVTIDQQPSRVFVLADFQSGKALMTDYNLAVGAGVDPASAFDGGILPPPFVDSSATGTQIKALATQAKTELDPAKRTTLYKQISKLANDHAMYLPYCRQENGYVHPKKIGGIEKSVYTLFGVSEARFLTVAASK